MAGRYLRLLLCAVAASGWGSWAYAQDAATDAQNKLLAKRAAEADCYRKLAEMVYGLKLTSDTYVRDFVTESDEIRTSVDEFVRGVRLGPPRYYDDGTCEVDGEVTIAKIVTKLKELHSTYYKGNVVKTTDIEHITQTVKRDVLRATGAGAPRPEVPAGFEDVGELPPGYTATRTIPDIWKSVGPQARLMAERAARVDAQRRLLERIKGLRLTSDTLVRDFVTESDEIRTHARGLVVGAREVSKYLHDDELIVEVTMEVSIAKVFTKIKELHTEYYKGDRVRTTDVVNVQKSVKRDWIRETGSGVPPSKFLKQAQASGVTMPDWMGERIAATGQGTDPKMESAQGKLKAARAATLDAMRKLAEEVYGLTVSSDTTVRDFITQHDDIATQVEAMLAGAVTGEPEFAGGVATVEVSMPASDVWSVIHQHILILQRRS